MMQRTDPLRLLATITFATLCGCAKPPSDSASAPARPVASDSMVGATRQESAIVDRQSPDSPIAAVAQTYANADHYADRAVMTLSYQLDDGRSERSVTTLTTEYSSPNRVHLELASEDNVVQIRSDGTTVTARIIDPVTNNFDGQQVVKSAPDKLTIGELYAATELTDPLHPTEMLSALLGSPVGLDQTPLSLLLGESRLAEVLAKARATETESLTIGQEPAKSLHVLEATLPDGRYRLWVEPDTHLIRRLEFPTANEQLPPGVVGIGLTIDFLDVSLSSIDSQNFAVEQDWGAHRVTHFVLPPLDLPSDLIGKQLPPLQLADPGGNTVTMSNENAKPTVLIWFQDHPSSRLVLEQLQQLRGSMPQPTAMFGVYVGEDVDPAALLKKWNIDTPCLLDPKLMGRDLLHIEQAPTTLVLGQGKLQYLEVGANPNIAGDVPMVLERLAAGEDVGAILVDDAREAKNRYRQQLARAASGSTGGWVEEPTNELPAASKPQQLVLKEAWSQSEIKEPGNMLVLPGKQKRILVVSGWNEIVVLTEAGEVQRRIRLQLPEDEGISFLRAGKDQRDRPLLAAASRGGRTAFVFDLTGKLILQYPPNDDDNGLVGDLLLADTDADSQPELIVGWQGNDGVEAVSLQGKRVWLNQAMTSVVSLTTMQRAREEGGILCTGQSGLIVAIDPNGRTMREASVGSTVIHQICAWPGSARGFEAIVSDVDAGGESASHYCGIALSVTGELIAHGLDPQLQTKWQFALPTGVFRHQVDAPQTATIPTIGPAWIFPGPDGSVHVIGTDGTFRDRFRTGLHLRGLANLHLADRSLLLLASDGKVAAYALENAE